MPYGPELVVPNVVFDGQVDLIYSFTGQSDDGGVRFKPAEALVSGDYDYSFECLTTDGQFPMNVRICDQPDMEDGQLRGAIEPGIFTGTISITQQRIDEYGNSDGGYVLLLNVTGSPTIATARNLSVKRRIS